MKVLLKKEVCGSCEQCTGLTRKQLNMLLNEKKKKKAKMQTHCVLAVPKRIRS